MPTQALTGIATLPELFERRVQETPHGEAYREYDPALARWMTYDWQRMHMKVREWSRALAGSGLKPGARVGILLPNGVATVCIDQAALRCGMVPVPMHAIDNPANSAYIIADSQVEILVLSDWEKWEGIAAAINMPIALKQVVLVGEHGSHCRTLRDIPALSLAAWLATGEGVPEPELARTGPDALAAIVYTSGTTGRPKGVMLSHANVLSNVEAVLRLVDIFPEDLFLSFLPLSHTFERTIGYYLAIATGSCVAYVRSVAQIVDDLKEVRPTLLVSVPRIYERFYARLQEMLEQGGAAKRALFGFAQQVGWRRFRRAQGLGGASPMPAWLDELFWLALDPLVARKIRDQFGGRVRVAVSGGAPISEHVAACFIGLGVPVLQGYGLTETSPVISANSLVDNWPQTVGHALRDVEVRIGEGSELLVRGPNVMQGYLNRPEETARSFTADGWLRTGDQAALEDGRIRITGRLKEIIVTSTGEKIAPADLELAIAEDPLFEQVLVIGEQRPFISVLVVLAREPWNRLAHELGVNPNEAAALLDARVQEAVMERIRKATSHFPSYAVPRAAWLTLDPWTVESGLITPTLKLKRSVLHARYSAQIEALYGTR